MQRILFLGISIYLLCGNVTAQNSSTNSSTIMDSRTDAERIEFLKQVAMTYFSDEDYESAVNAYERILEINPKDKEARFVISYTYIQAKQYLKAEKILLELLEESPEDFKLMNNLAWLYATAEDPALRNGQRALSLAQKAMVLSPNDHQIWNTLAEAYYITGEYEKAHRAIVHMANLAATSGKGVTKKQVEEYNEQILKCKRALDTQKALDEKKDRKEK
ncbi:MAG TPA: tetratricopeptide repeat protein [Pontiella sp.]